MKDEILEILRRHLGEEIPLSTLVHLINQLETYFEGKVKETTKNLVSDHEDEIEEWEEEVEKLEEQLEDFKNNPMEVFPNREKAIVLLLGKSDIPSLADEIKVEWFKDNFDKINPYKNL